MPSGRWGSEKGSWRQLLKRANNVFVFVLFPILFSVFGATPQYLGSLNVTIFHCKLNTLP